MINTYSETGKREMDILYTLDTLLRKKSVRTKINSILIQVERKLISSPDTLLEWAPVPLDTYGKRLPNIIRSSWVFVLPARISTGAERHPNSHQRMMSYRGSGDLQIWNNNKWSSNILISNLDAPIENRWISIPPMIWHQAVVNEKNWVVVSFHTVPENELIEERPNSEDKRLISRRRYLNEKDR